MGIQLAARRVVSMMCPMERLAKLENDASSVLLSGAVGCRLASVDVTLRHDTG